MVTECRIGYRRVYGIAAVDGEDGEKIILDAAIDVSENRETAEALADRCNRDRVALGGFRAYLTDWLNRQPN